MIALIGLPLLFFVFSALMDPRPYFIPYNYDVENDYYYTARLLHSGFPLYRTTHPGTPIYWISYLVMFLSGQSIRAVQNFFNINYLIICLFHTGIFTLIYKVLLKDKPFGVSAAVLSSMMIWPAYFLFLNVFSPDSFIVPLGILSVALFWRSLESPKPPNKFYCAFSAISLGACLALKLSFIFVSTVLVAAVASHFYFAFNGRWKPIFVHLCAYLFLTAASFVLLTFPIAFYMPGVMITLARINPSAQNMVPLFFERMPKLMEDYPFTVIFMGIVGILFLISIILAGFNFSGGGSARQSKRDHLIPGIIFCGLGLLQTAVFLSRSVFLNLDLPLGVGLRNTLPFAVFPSFIILLIWALNQHTNAFSNIKLGKILAGISVPALMLTLFLHLTSRHQYLESETKKMDFSKKEMLELLYKEKENNPSARIAYWGVWFDASWFHFLGNATAGRNLFYDELSREFPNFIPFILLPDRKDVPHDAAIIDKIHNSTPFIFWPAPASSKEKHAQKIIRNIEASLGGFAAPAVAYYKKLRQFLDEERTPLVPYDSRFENAGIVVVQYDKNKIYNTVPLPDFIEEVGRNLEFVQIEKIVYEEKKPLLSNWAILTLKRK